ncbi:MAG: EhaE family protein [Methanobrevibacter boviskoreani]|jgi:energy-converting hydrogenase A subunit E|uniref:EhaE family protein n=1 Tax=Methanobrevibacter TaxID=2172 RepID=UPI0003348A2D|nr:MULTISPECIES: EhaE family protein [Methanobrevibacter]AGN16837.1 energy-converting hydrogenase A subunit E EhaE [Methanobrevibacter sp. AbM4]MCI6774920.1 EhaE family protein [Methanobrevibacter boviskoreani]MCI6931447.1 EhaE family protein [Methanobrevibacter boviskoreani]MDD6257339.1 EhaE family protein [Methanobrevibacter boviskoreani]MDY5613785.1 EhaE family protein [Methanobrevibacter boviskoreani]
MFNIYIWFYAGIILAVVGTLGACWGPGVKDPVVRTMNTEVASVGVSLILLCYNHTLALLTMIATSVICTLILFRAISRLEEIGADV